MAATRAELITALTDTGHPGLAGPLSATVISPGNPRSSAAVSTVAFWPHLETLSPDTPAALLVGSRAELDEFFADDPSEALPITLVLWCGANPNPLTDLAAVCRSSDIALLTTPAAPDTVAAVLFRALGEAAARESARLRTVERLLHAADADDPLVSLVRVMAELCDGSAMVFDHSDTLLHSAGAGPTQLVARHLAEASTPEEPFEIGRWQVIARRLRVRAQHYTLVLAGHNACALNAVADTIFDTLAAILRSFGAVEGFARTQQTVSSAALLRELELGVSLSDEQRHWARMAACGFTPYQKLRHLVCVTANGETLSRHDFDTLFAPLPEGAATPHPDRLPVLAIESAQLGSQQPGTRMLVPDGEISDTVIERLRRAEHRFFAGVSEPFQQLSALPEIARATETALRLARQYGANDQGFPAVVRVDALSPLEWLLARATSVRDRSVLTGYAEPLRPHPELRETLLSYLAANGVINDAAHDLNIHPNTLRYRLARVEQLLSATLADPTTITNLCLAFHPELLAARAQRARSTRRVRRETPAQPPR